MKNKKYFYYTLGLLIILIFCTFFYFRWFNKKRNVSDNEIGNTINIGVVTIMGEDFKYSPILGSGAILGAKAYLNKINASGGIYNRKINLIIKDTIANSPIATEKSAKKIMHENDIFAFMWPVCTIQTMAMHNVLKDTGIPLLFPLSSKIKSDDKGTYYIRSTYYDEVKNKIGKFVTSMGKGSTSIITERQEICYISKSLLLNVAKVLNKKIDPGFYYNPFYRYDDLLDINDPKFEELKTNIETFKKNNVKSVVLFTTLRGVYFLKIAKMLDYHPTIVSPSILSWDFVLTHYFPATSNFYATMSFPIPSVSKEMKVINEFEQDMKDNGYTGYLSIVMLEGYLGAKILVDTLKKTGPSLTRKKFIVALESTKKLDYGGISFSFSPTENVGNHEVYFYKYTNGLPSLVKD